MSINHPPAFIPPEIIDLRRQIDRWRANPKKSREMPASLWDTATHLAEKHKVSRVAKWLNVGYMALKRRVAKSQRPTPQARLGPAKNGFLQLFSDTTEPAEDAATVVELTNPEGSTMTMRIPVGHTIDVPSLVKSFCGLPQ